MNGKNILVGAISFLAGAIVAAAVTFAVMNPASIAAEAHAQAADERAQTCEAKFQKSTVIYLSATSPAVGAIGVNLLGGLVRLSPGAAITGAMAAGEQPQPEYVIPAMVTPRAMVATPGQFYTWVDKNGHQEGPYAIC